MRLLARATRLGETHVSPRTVIHPRNGILRVCVHVGGPAAAPGSLRRMGRHTIRREKPARRPSYPPPAKCAIGETTYPQGGNPCFLSVQLYASPSLRRGIGPLGMSSIPNATTSDAISGRSILRVLFSILLIHHRSTYPMISKDAHRGVAR